MSITINLTPAEEERLSYMAMQSGLAPEEMARKLVSDHLPSAPVTTADTVRAKLRQWQKETETQTSPAISSRELFARWAVEDAKMTEGEKEAEDQLWQDFESGINNTRAALNMRQL